MLKAEEFENITIYDDAAEEDEIPFAKAEITLSNGTVIRNKGMFIGVYRGKYVITFLNLNWNEKEKLFDILDLSLHDAAEAWTVLDAKVLALENENEELKQIINNLTEGERF